MEASPVTAQRSEPSLDEATTLAEALAASRVALRRTPLDLSPREGALLLAHALDSTEIELLTHGERPLTPDRRAIFRDLLDRRLAGEPVAYLTGQREFYGRDFLTDPRGLIPRPETEHLVELALELEMPRQARVLDIGTGSGCIAVTLAVERPDWSLVAVDSSPGALALAAENARRLGVHDRLALIGCDLATAFDAAPFDLVVSNPPYISRSETASLSHEIIDHEPLSALVSPGEDGTTLTAHLLETLTGLRQGVPVAIEIGAGRLAAVTAHATGLGFRVDRVVDDYASIPRVVLLRRDDRPEGGR